ncbi:MAG: type 1 glutamine amidotransferase [Peptococcaceae bacterium]|nr:type 1 glutamine amidotransferase [Peptococcaceae bacterium]
MKALLVQHQREVPPGRVLEVLEDLGWEAEVLLMEDGHSVPSFLDGYDCLVLLGGTMNVDDVAGYPYLEKLRLFTAGALEKGFPVLGLCLGAQLMSRAAGGRVHRNRCGEIGWRRVRLTGDGLGDRLLEGTGEYIEVFHWHEDSFDLPDGSVLLGKSEVCPHQIMRIGKWSYGFQFHPEVDRETVLSWIGSCRDEVESKLGPDGPERLIRQTEEKMPRYRRLCQRLLTNYFRNIENA